MLGRGAPRCPEGQIGQCRGEGLRGVALQRGAGRVSPSSGESPLGTQRAFFAVFHSVPTLPNVSRFRGEAFGRFLLWLGVRGRQASPSSLNGKRQSAPFPTRWATKPNDIIINGCSGTFPPLASGVCVCLHVLLASPVDSCGSVCPSAFSRDPEGPQRCPRAATPLPPHSCACTAPPGPCSSQLPCSEHPCLKHKDICHGDSRGEG